MYHRRNRISAVRSQPDRRIHSPAAFDRRTVLMGLTALIGMGLATRLRADDLSAETILNDPDAPVGGNPKGDLTIVSFFDYNCPFCKRTVEPLKAVLTSDGNIRHVYKDWPILAPSSVSGAKLALAAKYQDRYEDAYHALMGIEGSRVSEDRMRKGWKARASICRNSKRTPTGMTPRSTLCSSATLHRRRGSACLARPSS